MRLWNDGWFQPEASPSGVSVLRNPKEPKNETPVIVAGKDQSEVRGMGLRSGSPETPLSRCMVLHRVVTALRSRLRSFPASDCHPATPRANIRWLPQVDNDYFLIPVKILDHEGALYSSFPVENRLLPQGLQLRA